MKRNNGLYYKEKISAISETNLNKTAQYRSVCIKIARELETLVCEGEGLGGET